MEGIYKMRNKRRSALRIALTIFTFTFLLNLFPSQAKQKYPTTYWGLFADFRTEDLVRINAWDMVGKSGWNYDWGIVSNPKCFRPFCRGRKNG